MRTTRIFAAKETPTIMEFPRAFNEEAFHAFDGPRFGPARSELLLEPGLRRIMVEENASLAGGLQHACKKTFRSRNYRAAFQDQGMDSCEQQTAPGIYVQGFHHRVRQYDACRARGRRHEPSSGVVQRVEQSGHRSEYAQRERHQRLRLQAGRKNRRSLRRVICTPSKTNSPHNECRPPAEKIQPGLDFSCAALGGGPADSWNSLLSAAGGPDTQCIVSRSFHGFPGGPACVSAGFAVVL